MQGLKVKCTNCGRTDFITTEKYNPDTTARGDMVKSLLPYQHDWLCSVTTLCSELTCPECLAQLAPSGRLTIVDETIPEYVCDICGKTFGVKIALAGHMRSHKTGESDAERKMESI